jgi:type IV secretion system protein VirD4
VTARASRHGAGVEEDLSTAVLGWLVGPLVGLVAVLMGCGWVAAGASHLAAGLGWASVPAGRLPAFVAVLVTSRDPVLAAARTGAGPVGSPVVFWLTFGVLLGCSCGLAGLLTAGGLRRAERRRAGPGAAWGDRTVERRMAVPTDPAQRPGRLVAGRGTLTGRLLAADDCTSALVFGPNGSGKSTGLIAPNVLEWSGPLVMTTTKVADVALVHARRAALGPVWVVAPGGCPGYTTSGWSPVHYGRGERGPGRRVAVRGLRNVG